MMLMPMMILMMMVMMMIKGGQVTEVIVASVMGVQNVRSLVQHSRGLLDLEILISIDDHLMGGGQGGS